MQAVYASMEQDLLRREAAHRRVLGEEDRWVPQPSLSAGGVVPPPRMPRSTPAWSSLKRGRVAVSTAAPSSDKEAQRRRATVAKLWQITTNFPGLSAKAARIEACPPELRDEYDKQVQARLQSFSLSTLEGSFRTWRRYLIFLASVSPPPPPAASPGQPCRSGCFLGLGGGWRRSHQASEVQKARGEPTRSQEFCWCEFSRSSQVVVNSSRAPLPHFGG